MDTSPFRICPFFNMKFQLFAPNSNRNKSNRVLNSEHTELIPRARPGPTRARYNLLHLKHSGFIIESSYSLSCIIPQNILLQCIVFRTSGFPILDHRPIIYLRVFIFRPASVHVICDKLTQNMPTRLTFKF
jgi:hypothetical protein